MHRKMLVLAVFAFSGAVSAMAFPPGDMPWVLWVAIASALVAAVSVSFRLAAFGGLLYGFMMAELLLGWFFATFGPFALFLHFVLALFYALIFGCVQRAAQRWGPHALLWAAPVIWVGVEFFRSECWPLKFAWFGLGYSQHANLPILQIASIGGVYLISLLIAAANGALAWFLQAPSRRRLVAPLAAVVVVAAAHLAGASTMRPAAGDFEVVGIEGERRDLSGFLDESERALTEHPGARLVIWPEYAVPGLLTGDDALSGRISEFARQRGVPMLVGATRAHGDYFDNTIFLFDPQGRIAGLQVKSVPVQFLRDGLPAATREPMKMFDGHLIGGAVCYDMGFPYVTRELASRGAEMLAYPTMDAREWGEGQHRQHASVAPLRAVENRRWLVRVVSSGFSRVVDPYGRVVRSTGMGEGTIDARVGWRSDRTIYTRFGWLLPNVCLIAAIVLMILTIRVRGSASR